jgi:hypothetical protein
MWSFLTSKVFLLPAAVISASLLAWASFSLLSERGKVSRYKAEVTQLEALNDEYIKSNADLQNAIGGLESDKRLLQKKIAQLVESEAISRAAAESNAREAARVSDVLKTIRENQYAGEPDSIVRVRSRAIDFLRDRQTSAPSR